MWPGHRWGYLTLDGNAVADQYVVIMLSLEVHVHCMYEPFRRGTGVTVKGVKFGHVHFKTLQDRTWSTLFGAELNIAQ